jgi:predicted nicotinamide N-methyase
MVGGRVLRIVAPDDPDRLLNDAAVLELNRRDDYMPYWAYFWPGAFLLAEAVAREPWPAGAEVLELGCGLGLAGLTALAAGAERVVFTDYDETPLRFVAASAGENGFARARWETGQLDWREPPARRFSVILGADVLYERRLVPLVAGVIARMLAPDGIALVAGPYRVATEDLDGWLLRNGLVATAEPLTARDEFNRTIQGTLHRICHEPNHGAGRPDARRGGR